MRIEIKGAVFREHAEGARGKQCRLRFIKRPFSCWI